MPDVVDDVAVLVLMLARRHLAVALDGGILLAGLRLGGFLRSVLKMTSSEHTSKRPAAGSPFGETGGWLKRRLTKCLIRNTYRDV